MLDALVAVVIVISVVVLGCVSGFGLVRLMQKFFLSDNDLVRHDHKGVSNRQDNVVHLFSVGENEKRINKQSDPDMRHNPFPFKYYK
jgi:hypothetical protein